MRQHAVIAVLVAAGVEVQAAPARLGESELRTAVAGKTVTIDTPLGLPLSVNYGANGIMTGSVGTALAVYLGSAQDRGRWSIKQGKLCQKWFRWLSGETTCLSLRQEGSKIFWLSDEGRTGTATIEPGPPVLAGTAASGLGLPVAAERPRQVDEPAERVPEASRAWAATFRPERTAVKSEREAEHDFRHREAEASPLLQAPHEAARAARASLEPTPARYAMASLLPTWGPRPPSPITVTPYRRDEDDPFETAPQPMRRALEHAAKEVMEHRWCLANAFAQGPSEPLPVASHSGTTETETVAAELMSSPTLLAVAQEQNYDGELPLHAAACLTEEPALNAMAKLPATAR